MKIFKRILKGIIGLAIAISISIPGLWVYRHVTPPKEKYAILISAGQTIYDNKVVHFEYWGNLLMTYKTLMEQGYTHENIYVFYGDGPDNDFNSKHKHYRHTTYWSIPTIIDYSNSRGGMTRGFKDLAYKITNKDKLVIHWIFSHGDVTERRRILYKDRTPDDYEVSFEKWIGNQKFRTWVSKADIFPIIDIIKDYKQREIYWMTCYAGAVIKGDLQLGGPRTTVITSSKWNQVSWATCPESCRNYFSRICVGGYYTSEFNWVMYGVYHNQYFDGSSIELCDSTLKWPITPYKLYEELQHSKMMYSDVQMGGHSPIAMWVKTSIWLWDLWDDIKDVYKGVKRSVKQFIKECLEL